MAAKRHPNKTLMNHVFCSPDVQVPWWFITLSFRVFIPFLLLSSMAIHYYQEVMYMSLSISDAHVFSAALKKQGRNESSHRLNVRSCLTIPYLFRRIWNVVVAPQALRGFTKSAGRSAFPQTTISSRMEPTGPALHTRRYCGCSRCATKRACLLSWLLQLYLQVRIKMPCKKNSPKVSVTNKCSMSEKAKKASRPD